MRMAPDGAVGTAFSDFADWSAGAPARATSRIGNRTGSRSFFTARMEAQSRP
jgi:hypothetical protein